MKALRVPRLLASWRAAKPGAKQQVLQSAAGETKAIAMEGHWAAAQSYAGAMPGAQPYGAQAHEGEYDGSLDMTAPNAFPPAFMTPPWMLPVNPFPSFLPVLPPFNFQQQAFGGFPYMPKTMLASQPPQQQQQLQLQVQPQPQVQPHQARHFSTSPKMARRAAKASRPSRQPTTTRHSDPITPPSAASGGIPEPTASYLLRASFLPRALPRPRPMLVVIDLNGTLLYRPSRKAPGASVARPHAADFLAYCTRTFHVMVWSSARLANVRRLLDSLLPPGPEQQQHEQQQHQQQQRGVVAVWGREQFGLSPADFAARVMCYKRLARVWDDAEVARRHPYFDKGERWDQGNTVLVDDTLEKARSEPHNAIQVPEFTGDVDEDPAVLPQVHDYLNTLACQADISTYIRANPFRAQGTVEWPEASWADG